MKGLAKTVLIVLMAVMTADCSRESDNAVPRRTAYPRTELYADSTIAASLSGLCFDIKAEADTTTPHKNWLDIIYPRYNAVIHVTARHLNSSEALSKAIFNRRERMSLDRGDRAATATNFENNAGFKCQIITSLDGGPSPVQFLACRHDGYLVSGTAVIKGQAEPADSVAPTVRALASDIETLLKSLR